MADPAATLFTDDHVAYPYTTWVMTVEYVYDAGVVQMPVGAAPANPGQPPNSTPCVLARLHAPYGQLVVTWEATRTGNPPTLPSPDTDNPNLVLLSARFGAMSPALEPDGYTLLYGVSGVYVYACKVPVWYLDGIPMGTTVYQNIPASVNELGPQQFVRGLF